MWIENNGVPMHLDLERKRRNEIIHHEMFGSTGHSFRMPMTQNEWEEEALEIGVPVETAKKLKQMEYEDFTERIAEQHRLCEKWEKEAYELQKTYSDFCLLDEIKNSRFKELIQLTDMRTAYEILHKDELLQPNQDQKNSVRSGPSTPLLASIGYYFLYLVVFWAVAAPIILVAILVIGLLRKANLLFLVSWLGVFDTGYIIGINIISYLFAHLAAMHVHKKVAGRICSGVVLSLGISFLTCGIIFFVCNLINDAPVGGNIVSAIYGVFMIYKAKQ